MDHYFSFDENMYALIKATAPVGLFALCFLSGMGLAIVIENIFPGIVHFIKRRR